MDRLRSTDYADLIKTIIFVVLLIAVPAYFLATGFFQGLRRGNRGAFQEKIFAQASRELNSPERKEGLWAECFVKSKGNEVKAKVEYLKRRVIELTEIEDKKSKT